MKHHFTNILFAIIMHNQMVNINIVQLFNATCVRLYYTIIEKKNLIWIAVQLFSFLNY